MPDDPFSNVSLAPVSPEDAPNDAQIAYQDFNLPAPDLAAPNPAAPVVTWSQIKASPQFSQATPEQQQSALANYTQDVRNHLLSLDGADPAAIDDRLKDFTTRENEGILNSHVAVQPSWLHQLVTNFWYGGDETQRQQAGESDQDYQQRLLSEPTQGERAPGALPIAKGIDALTGKVAGFFGDKETANALRTGAGGLTNLVEEGTKEPNSNEISFQNLGLPKPFGQQKTVPLQIAAAIGNLPVGIANFALSPGATASKGLQFLEEAPALIQRAVALGFTGQQISQAFEHGATLQERVESLLGAALGAGGVVKGPEILRAVKKGREVVDQVKSAAAGLADKQQAAAQMDAQAANLEKEGLPIATSRARAAAQAMRDTAQENFQQEIAQAHQTFAQAHKEIETAAPNEEETGGSSNGAEPTPAQPAAEAQPDGEAEPATASEAGNGLNKPVKHIVGPALVDAEGKVIAQGKVGETHAQVFERTIGTPEFDKALDAFTNDKQHAFVDSEGGVHDRASARAVAVAARQAEPGEKGLQSQELRDIEEVSQAAAPKEVETPPAEKSEPKPNEQRTEPEPMSDETKVEPDEEFGRRVAKELGLTYSGVQEGYKDDPGYIQFRDPQAGDTAVAAIPGNTIADFKQHLEETRAKFNQPEVKGGETNGSSEEGQSNNQDQTAAAKPNGEATTRKNDVLAEGENVSGKQAVTDAEQRPGFQSKNGEPQKKSAAPPKKNGAGFKTEPASKNVSIRAGKASDKATIAEPDTEVKPKSLSDLVNTTKRDLDKAINLPKGATAVRVTDSKGRSTILKAADLKGANPLEGAGVKKIEAGAISKDKKFVPAKEEIVLKQALDDEEGGAEIGFAPEESDLAERAERERGAQPSRNLGTPEELGNEPESSGAAPSAIKGSAVAHQDATTQAAADALRERGAAPATNLADQMAKRYAVVQKVLSTERATQAESEHLFDRLRDDLMANIRKTGDPFKTINKNGETVDYGAATRARTKLIDFRELHENSRRSETPFHADEDTEGGSVEEQRAGEADEAQQGADKEVARKSLREQVQTVKTQLEAKFSRNPDRFGVKDATRAEVSRAAALVVEEKTRAGLVEKGEESKNVKRLLGDAKFRSAVESEILDPMRQHLAKTYRDNADIMAQKDDILKRGFAEVADDLLDKAALKQAAELKARRIPLGLIVSALPKRLRAQVEKARSDFGDKINDAMKAIAGGEARTPEEHLFKALAGFLQDKGENSPLVFDPTLRAHADPRERANATFDPRTGETRADPINRSRLQIVKALIEEKGHGIRHPLIRAFERGEAVPERVRPVLEEGSALLKHAEESATPEQRRKFAHQLSGLDEFFEAVKQGKTDFTEFVNGLDASHIPTTLKGKISSVVERIVRLMRSLTFGGKPVAEGSVLDRAFRASLELAEGDESGSRQSTSEGLLRSDLPNDDTHELRLTDKQKESAGWLGRLTEDKTNAWEFTVANTGEKIIVRDGESHEGKLPEGENLKPRRITVPEPSDAFDPNDPNILKSDLPSDEGGRPESAALRDEDTGEVWSGQPLHGMLHDQIPDRENRRLEAGFVTKAGKFLTADETERRTGLSSGEELFKMTPKQRRQWFDVQREQIKFSSSLNDAERARELERIDRNQRVSEAEKPSDANILKSDLDRGEQETQAKFLNEFAQAHGFPRASDMAVNEPDLFNHAAELFRTKVEQTPEEEGALRQAAEEPEVQDATAERAKDMLALIDNKKWSKVPAGEIIRQAMDKGASTAPEFADAFKENGVPASVAQAVGRMVDAHFKIAGLERAREIAREDALQQAEQSQREPGAQPAKTDKEFRENMTALRAESRVALSKAGETLKTATDRLQRFARGYKAGESAGLKEGAKRTAAELKVADKWMAADQEKVRQDLTAYVNHALPPSERGRFISAITRALRTPGLNGDPGKMYRNAFKVVQAIENRSEDVWRNHTISEIKRISGRIVDSPTVDLAAKRILQKTLGNINLKRLRPSDIESLQKTKAFLDRQAAAGKDVFMPQRVLEAIESLAKTPADKLPSASLNALHTKIRLLEKIGRARFKSRAEAWDAEKEARLGELLAGDGKPLETRELYRPQPGEKLTFQQKVANWVNRRVNRKNAFMMGIMPEDVHFDMLQNGHGAYSGPIFDHIRTPLDFAWNRAENRAAADQDPLLQTIMKHKLTPQDSDIVGLWANLQQEGGEERELASGTTKETINKLKAKGLTAGQKEAYDYMRQNLDAALPEIQALMHDLYNIEVKPVEGYFPWQREWETYKTSADKPVFNARTGDVVSQEDLDAYSKIAGDFYARNTSRTSQGFTLDRKPGAATPIRHDAFGIFQQHVHNRARLLEMQRDLKMAGEMIRNDKFAQKFGDYGQRLTNDWLTQVATDGHGGNVHRSRLLDLARKGSNRSLVFFRLTSNVKHASAVPQGIVNAGGPEYYYRGAHHIFTPEGKAFMAQFPEVLQRQAGEVSLSELTKMMDNPKLFPRALAAADRFGFILGKEIDAINSRAVFIGRYLANLEAAGLAPDLTAPVNEKAAGNALVMMRRTVSSVLPKDIQPSLGRGMGFGGNVSAARTFFAFKQFALERFSLMYHDTPQAFKSGNYLRGAALVTALAAAGIYETNIAGAIRHATHLLTGLPDKEEKWPWWERLMVDQFNIVPIVSNIISAAQYGETGVPVADNAMSAVKDAARAATAKTAEGKESAAIRAASAAAQVAGVPGAGVISSTAKDLLLQKKKKPVGY